MLGIVSTELAVKPRTPNGHQLLGDWNPKDVWSWWTPISIFPRYFTDVSPETCQETDVSIAREVDKDLEANGEAAEDAGESASARHAAREKQREAGRFLGSKVDGDGDSTPYSRLICIWILYEYYVYVIVCI